MYNGISNIKNLTSSNYKLNIVNKKYVFYLLTLIIAFLIIVNNIFYIPNIAKASDNNQENIELEMKQEVENIIADLNIAELETIMHDFALKYPEYINGETFKEFLIKLISDTENIGFLDFFALFKQELLVLVKQILSPLLLIFVIILICNMFNFFKSERLKNSVSDVIYFIALSLIVIIVSVLIKDLINICRETTLNLKHQINVVFPLILTLMTTIGAVSSVSVYSPMLSFFSNTFLNVFINILFPVFTFIILTIIISRLTKNKKLNKMQGFFSSLFKWLLGSLSTIFMAFLSFQGLTAGARDGLSIKAAKFAIKNYIPFLGGYISEGFEIVKASSVLVKNAIGYSSIFLLFFTIIRPICYLCILSLGLKLISASCDLIDNINLSGLLFDIANALKYLVAIIVGVACMYFFILFLCISTGNAIF